MKCKKKPVINSKKDTFTHIVNEKKKASGHVNDAKKTYLKTKVKVENIILCEKTKLKIAVLTLLMFLTMRFQENQDVEKCAHEKCKALS